MQQLCLYSRLRSKEKNMLLKCYFFLSFSILQHYWKMAYLINHVQRRLHVFLHGWMLYSRKIITLFVFAKTDFLKLIQAELVLAQTSLTVRWEREVVSGLYSLPQTVMITILILIKYTAWGWLWLHDDRCSDQHYCSFISHWLAVKGGQHTGHKLSPKYGISRLVRTGWQP